MKILGFTRGTGWEELDGPQYYRTYLPLREVHRHDNGIETQMIGDKDIVNVSDAEMAGRDIYTMSRMYQDDYEAFIAYIHDQGALLVFDSDDDLTETYRLVTGRGREFCEFLGVADYITCSTPALADLFSQYTQRPPVVLRNCVDVDWMIERSAKSRRLVEGLTIGFSGSPTHYGDWYMPAAPLQRICRAYDVVPVLHGEMPRYMKYVDPDSLQLSGVPLAIYPIVLKQFDILLCAVDLTDGFNCGKSAVKALEAMALGIVPICSRLPSYMELALAGAPVVIVEEESRDGWYEAMANTIRMFGDERFSELRTRGPEWVRANRDMCISGYKQWENFYREIRDA
jgi:glycosyltransferase involved in cell wall biosynthesis